MIKKIKNFLFLTFLGLYNLPFAFQKMEAYYQGIGILDWVDSAFELDCIRLVKENFNSYSYEKLRRDCFTG